MVSLAVSHSRALRGIRAPSVRVEVHLANGLPSFMIVGLPEAAVRESRERVRAAILQSGFDFPNRRITVNLAPADLPKDSGRFDLSIATGILAASGQLPIAPLAGTELIGELSLSGDLRPVQGALALALGLRQDDSKRSLIVPLANLDDAACAGLPAVYGAASLVAVCDHLRGGAALTGPGHRPDPADAASGAETGQRSDDDIDLADVVGQPLARRALEIAAAGHHHLLLTGPPGTGKSLLARCLRGLLPPLADEPALAAAAVASATGRPRRAHWRQPALRQPHHTVSAAGLIGGGQPPRPGEISLAHHGVLLLDELPEFPRAAIESLREPLETGHIVVTRGPYSETFPSRFLLVATMNPCPCGYLGDPDRACRCAPEQVQRYLSRVSGPLLDRFDLGVQVAREAPDMADQPPSESSLGVADRVARARARQAERQSGPNGLLDAGAIARTIRLDAAGARLAEQALRRFHWSVRGRHRMLRVARTVADLAQADTVAAEHVAEAIALRRALESDAEAARRAADPLRA